MGSIGFKFCLIWCTLLADNSRVYPRNIQAGSGDNVTINCTSVSYVQWIFYNSEHEVMSLPLNVVEEGNTLYIHSANHGNQGYYECRGETEEYHEWSLAKVRFAAYTLLAVLDLLKPTAAVTGNINYFSTFYKLNL